MTTRQPYKPKYIPLYVSRTEKKELEPPAAKLEPHDISGLRQQIDNLSEEIRTSPVSYPKETMAADPYRRFALPTDVSRFERLRQGLRRDEEADINLGANYSRYRLEARQYEEEEPETRTTRIAKRDKSPPQINTRLRTYKSPQTPQYDIYEQDHFEDDYPEIKHESDEEDASMFQPTPQLRRYAGYNASSPQKRVTIEEPKGAKETYRPRSRESAFEEATRQAEEQFEQYVSDIEVSLGPEEARRFLREHKHFTHMLHDEYQSLRPKPTPKRAVTKKGIIKKVRPDIDYRDIEEEYEEHDPVVKHEEDYRPEEVSRVVKEQTKPEREVQEKEILRRVLSEPDSEPSSVSEKPQPSGIRVMISSSYRRVVGAWYTTTSPLLLLVTSFFFWQAIRLALTFFCLDDDEEFVRQQLIQGMSYAEIEQMWGLRGFNICGGVWRPPVPQ